MGVRCHLPSQKRRQLRQQLRPVILLQLLNVVVLDEAPNPRLNIRVQVISTHKLLHRQKFLLQVSCPLVYGAYDACKISNGEGVESHTKNHPDQG